MGPGTYLTSISMSSPGSLFAFTYLYLIFFTRYFLTRPSSLIILPMVLTGILTPSFFNLQCSFCAQSFVFFLLAITISLRYIGVSYGLVFGIVAWGINPSSPYSLYAFVHRSKLRLL